MSAEQIKADILVKLRNIIRYRQKLSRPTNSLNYEDFHKDILSYAGAVYHFKDRMIPWCKKNGTWTNPPLNGHIESKIDLLVCGDLFNTMKHGGCENRSDLSPRLSDGMTLETAGKLLAIRYNGLMKTGDIGPAAVPYNIEIFGVRDGTEVTLGNAVRFISKAFCKWMLILKQSGLLRPSDPVEAGILQELEPFASDVP